MILHFLDGTIQNPSVWVRGTANLNGRYEVEPKKLSRRSGQQNRYLHGVLIPEFRKALNSVGYDEVKDDVQCKLILKAMFLKRQLVNKETGEVIEYTADTSALSKEQMSFLFDEVIKFAAEHMNYQILFPNEQSEIFGQEQD